jgi:hypothetical protein
MSVELNDIVSVSFKGLCFGQRILFGHTYRVIVPPDPEKQPSDFLQEVVETVNGDLTGLKVDYLACLASNYVMNEIRAQIVSPTRSAYTSFPVSAAGTGSTAITANLQGAITLRTENGGRSQVATKKIGPLPTAASLTGLLTAAHTGVMDTLGFELLETIQNAGDDPWEMTPVIFHRLAVPGQPFSDNVTNMFVSPQTRTMSRRTVGRGE